MFQPQPTPYDPFASSSASFSSASYLGNASLDDNLNSGAAFDYLSGSSLTRSPLTLEISGGRGPIFANPNSNSVSNSNHNPTNSPAASSLSTSKSRQRALLRQRQHSLQSNSTMSNLVGEDDLAAQEAAAGRYQPDLKGPLIGNKKSSHAITEEYARADPIYVAKTSALPRTYSHYRPILGDGNCGWRAIAYSYFEMLQKLGSQSQIEEEHGRILSLSAFITNMAGIELWVFEDMLNEILDLLKDLASSLQSGTQVDDGSIILQKLNDSSVSDSIVYCLRLLASAWLKANSESYSGFIPEGLSVQGYCENVLQPPNTEIDHLGMKLLYEVLLQPVGVAVEIVYLDRSEGNQVNTHFFQDEDQNGIPTHPGGPVIHLLYRPGHYDILYKDGNSVMHQQQLLNSALTNTNVQVHRAAQFPTQRIEATPGSGYSAEDMSILASIPFYSSMPLQSHDGFGAEFSSIDYEPMSSLDTSSYDIKPMPTHSISISPGSPISPVDTVPVFPATSTIMPMRHTASRNNSVSSHFSPPNTHHSHSHSLPTSTLSCLSPPTTQILPASTFPTSPLQSLPSPSAQPQQHSQLPIRPSQYVFGPESQFAPPPSFQTRTFRDSHYNTRHYMNPNFQPEEWSPDKDEEFMYVNTGKTGVSGGGAKVRGAGGGTKEGRHRST